MQPINASPDPFLKPPRALAVGLLPFETEPIPNLVVPEVVSVADWLAVSGCTQLVPIETTVRPVPDPPEPPNEPLETLTSLFRHSGWNSLRNRLYAAMKVAEIGSSTLRRFAECGSQAHVHMTYDPVIEGDGSIGKVPAKVKVTSNACRNRWCKPCATDRARLLAGRLIELINGEPARFITLTQAAKDEPLADGITRLYKNYAKLRRGWLWMSSVQSAAATLEVTRNPDTGHWHPHLHVIAKGKYIRHADLKAVWHAITGDSYIVDIRYVRDEGKAARYVTKYLTKVMSPDVLRDQDAMVECLQALKGRRMVLLTGGWYGLNVKPDPDTNRWTYVSSLRQLLSKAVDGDADAIHLLKLLNGDTIRCSMHTKLPSQQERPPPDALLASDC